MERPAFVRVPRNRSPEPEVFLGSPSEGELRKGDVLMRIGNKEAGKMTHQEAHNYIKNQGNNLNIVVHRGHYMPQSPDVIFNAHPFSSVNNAPTSPLQNLPKTQFSGDGRRPFMPPTPPNAPASQLQDGVSDLERERIAITNQPHRTFPLIQPGLKVRHDVPIGSYLRHVSDPFVRAPPSSSMRSHPLVNQANEYLMKTKIQESVTSAASNSSSVGSPVRGRSETPDSGVLPPHLVHRQYNSPIHLYSPQNVAATITGQTGIPVTPVIVGNLVKAAVMEFAQDSTSVPSGPVRILDISKSPTYQTIYESEWKELRKDELMEHKPVENRVKSIPPAPEVNPFGTPRNRILQSKTFEMLSDTLVGESNF
uniref:PDZ domain protein n=1 Tax=Hemiscolopendra marginata TaxID=943146 RepID=A0A646QFA5_9MYRI